MEPGDTLRFPRVELATHAEVMAVGTLMTRERDLPLCPSERHHGARPMATRSIGNRRWCDDCYAHLALPVRQ